MCGSREGYNPWRQINQIDKADYILNSTEFSLHTIIKTQTKEEREEDKQERRGKRLT